jgi:class 3 adenylate cyclase
MATNDRYGQWWARYQRMAASPGAVLGMVRLIFGIDVRHVLGAIRVPTLVLHRTGFRFIPVEHARYLAQHIPGAKLVELPGEDGFLYLGNSDAIADNIEEFVTGSRRAVEPDRVLATVLLTDMVSSTDRAAALGDQRWKMLLDAHDQLVRQHLETYRGNLVRTTGDGILATFDGPARGVRCALGLRDALHDVGVEVRSGLHTGEIELREKEVGGIAVHIAARVMAEAGPGEVMVSSTVKDLVTGSDLSFLDRGTRQLRGVQREWQLFAVT